MSEKLALWEAAKREMEEYQFAAEAEVQPKWDVPEKIAINAAISSRFGDGKQSKPMSIENYVDAASSVIEAGACGVHIDFSWITDDKGRRLDRDVPPVEAYSAVVAPLRARFGNDFVVNVNVLHGLTFDVCMSSGARWIVRGGALCARPSRRFHGSGNSDARRYRRQARARDP